MNKYQLNLNLGSEVLGSGKTITATEVVESASSKELARAVSVGIGSEGLTALWLTRKPWHFPFWK